MSNYEDIRHFSRPKSNHPPMNRQDRAKIFAPFAALSGYGEAVHARDKVLVPPVVQTEHTQEQIDRVLQMLRKGERVTVIYFVPWKQTPEETLGEYVTVTDTVETLDVYNCTLRLKEISIPFENIVEIRSEKIDKLETQYEYRWQTETVYSY